MKLRILIGTLVGTVVAFAYGFVTWAALDLWAGKVQNVPAAVDMGAVVNRLAADGAYRFPPFDNEKHAQLQKTDAQAAEVMWAAYETEFQKGPVGVLLVRKTGVPVMDGGTFATSIGLDAACALLMAFFVAGTACPSWAGRWTYGLMVALFAAIVANAADLSWFKFPTNYVLYDMADLFLKWTVTSAAVAAVVGGTKSCPFHTTPAAQA